MKADLTRSTFDHAKHYSSVRMQQGRVQLDADWNEQQDIAAHRVHTGALDVIGACGAPDHPQTEAKHFKLAASGKDFKIAPGRFYVHGILCENESEVLASAQPDLPAGAPLVQLKSGATKKLSELAAAGTFVAYLDVWQRHITALEDGGIRETALNGPDTATRLKTVWQVKLLEVDANVRCGDLAALQAWKDQTAESSGTLTARAEKAQAATDPCSITAAGGFRGLENQLYRVEVHKGGPRAAATFKWSRDNGAVVTRIRNIDAANKRLTVEDTGKDAVLGFAPNQWVELLDDDHELLGVAGQLAQVDSVNPGARTIVLKALAAPPPNVTRNAKLRRWDQTGAKATANGIAMEANFTALEDGVEVKFGDAAKIYRSGDYWLIPARSSLADIEWPRDNASPPNPKERLRDGTRHYYCPLGILTLAAAGNDFAFTNVTDCRKLFPPLTGIVSFFYVGGDGQETRPGKMLPKPLQVGVADTQGPVALAMVKFKISDASAGKLTPGNLTEITVPTGLDGIAQCAWQLDANPAFPSQTVEATLVETSYTALNLPVRFNANLSVAEEVAYRLTQCEETAPNVPTVQKLLKAQVAGWPLQDPPNSGITTAKEILEAFLCKLDAKKLPYDPAAQANRWQDIADAASIPLPVTVQSAIDNLVANLESSDIGYRPACGDDQPNTVRARLGVPADQSSKVSEVLDRLLCKLDATHIPIDIDAVRCKAIKEAKAQTVQEALDALCQFDRGTAATTGLVVFKDVRPDSFRLSREIEHGHGNKKVSISLAFDLPKTPGTEGQLLMQQSNAAETASELTLFVLSKTADSSRFAIRLWDRRAGTEPPREVRVRWWALLAERDLGVVEAPVTVRLPPEVIDVIVVDRLRVEPGLVANADTARRLGIPLVDLQEAFSRLGR